MRVAYLGFFSKVFDWVFEHILEPVVKFVANILSTVFEWVFSNVLMPILTAVFKTVLPWVLELLQKLFAGLLYSILASLCKILDYLQEIFDIFSGAQEVTYKVSSTQTIKGQFLECLFYSPAVQKMYWIIFLAAFLLAGVFTIIAVMKSTIDLDFENKRPIGAVLRAAFKAIVTFLLLQVVVFFTINVSGVIIRTIENGSTIAMSEDATKTSLGRIVFCLATMDAANDSSINISTLSDEYKDKDVFSIGARKKFYSGESDYSDKGIVEDNFNLVKFDFLTSGIVVIFIAVVMAICAITFVQRVFEVILLYLVSPFFVATMPLDDGEKYKKWKDLFIAKIFGGYGSVLSMKIFLLLVPVIMGNGIVYGDGTDSTGTILMKIVFLCGGAYSLYKAGPMITTLINWQAGSAEASTAAGVGAYAGKQIHRAAGTVGSLAIAGAAAPFKFGAGLAGRALGVGDHSSTQDEKWNQMQRDGLSDEDRSKLEAKEQEENSKDSGGKANLDAKKGDDKADIKGDTDKADIKGDIDKADIKGDTDKADIKGDTDKADDKSDNGAKLDGKGDGNLEGKAEANEEKRPDHRWGISKKFDSFMKSCHKVLPHKANKDGSYSVGLLGFRINYDKHGNRVGFKVPCASFSYDKNGRYQAEKLKIPGILTAERGNKSGFSITKVPAIGLKREEGTDGKMHKTNLLGVYERKADPQGKYHTSSVMGIKFGQKFNTDTQQYESSGVRVGNFIFGGAELNSSAKDEPLKPGQRRTYDSNNL